MGLATSSATAGTLGGLIQTAVGSGLGEGCVLHARLGEDPGLNLGATSIETGSLLPSAGLASLRGIQTALGAVTPNPLRRGAARIDFAVGRESRVRLSIADLQGRLVRLLADQVFQPGQYQRNWDGRDGSGAAPAGVYFVRYDAAGQQFTTRFALVR